PLYVGNAGKLTLFPPAGRQGRGSRVPQPPAGATLDEAAQVLKTYHEAESSISAVDRAKRHVETLVPDYKDNRLLRESREPIIRVLGQQAEVAPATTLSLDAVEYA